MHYVNERFRECMLASEENRRTLADMKRDVDAFLPSFSDDAGRVSRWGHYYFCDEDGGRLIFDPSQPHKHRCAVCGKVYESETLDGVWTTFYRNRAVVLAQVSALIYCATGEERYRRYALDVLEFYAEHYSEFPLHNKENVMGVSYDDMKWGCGKIMPQNLNEAIVAIRFIATIEMLRDTLDEEWLSGMHTRLFREIFALLKPQVVEIHNISCWCLAAIGVMGLSLHDEEMIRFAFESPLNMHEQLARGVTADAFWYEGSIHYNFFLLEGVSYLFLFSRLYDYDFGRESTAIFERMLVQAYGYAFDNQYLPNPNDGWPNLNLRTFSYVYHTAARAFGEDSPVGNIVKLIEADPSPRTILPLSEPYYSGNSVCMEQLLFNIDFDYKRYTQVPRTSKLYARSNFAMLRDENWNVFLKYGLNGASHAHPDIMGVELMCRGHRISRDLSNAGYRARLCNEWHRKTISHSTVCWNGRDITSVSPGECVRFDPKRVCAVAKNVYENVDYCRELSIDGEAVQDCFTAGGQDGVYDYFFHLESDITLEHSLKLEPADLGFRENGYQHIQETYRVVAEKEAELTGSVGAVNLRIHIDLALGQTLYLLRTLDNPVSQTRRTLLIRGQGDRQTFSMRIQII